MLSAVLERSCRVGLLVDGRSIMWDGFRFVGTSVSLFGVVVGATFI